jgi:hypothetical protein
MGIGEDPHNHRTFEKIFGWAALSTFYFVCFRIFPRLPTGSAEGSRNWRLQMIDFPFISAGRERSRRLVAWRLGSSHPET